MGALLAPSIHMHPICIPYASLLLSLYDYLILTLFTYDGTLYIFCLSKETGIVSFFCLGWYGERRLPCISTLIYQIIKYLNTCYITARSILPLGKG